MTRSPVQLHFVAQYPGLDAVEIKVPVRQLKLADNGNKAARGAVCMLYRTLIDHDEHLDYDTLRRSFSPAEPPKSNTYTTPPWPVVSTVPRALR